MDSTLSRMAAATADVRELPTKENYDTLLGIVEKYLSEQELSHDKFTPGVLIEGSSVHTPEELNEEIIRLAISKGWEGADLEDHLEMVLLVDEETTHAFIPADLGDKVLYIVERLNSDEQARAQRLSEIADDATDWLHENYAPVGHYIGMENDAFGVWENEEE